VPNIHTYTKSFPPTFLRPASSWKNTSLVEAAVQVDDDSAFTYTARRIELVRNSVGCYSERKWNIVHLVFQKEGPQGSTRFKRSLIHPFGSFIVLFLKTTPFLVFFQLNLACIVYGMAMRSRRGLTNPFYFVYPCHSWLPQQLIISRRTIYGLLLSLFLRRIQPRIKSQSYTYYDKPTNFFQVERRSRPHHLWCKSGRVLE